MYTIKVFSLNGEAEACVEFQTHTQKKQTLLTLFEAISVTIRILEEPFPVSEITCGSDRFVHHSQLSSRTACHPENETHVGHFRPSTRSFRFRAAKTAKGKSRFPEASSAPHQEAYFRFDSARVLWEITWLGSQARLHSTRRSWRRGDGEENPRPLSHLSPTVGAHAHRMRPFALGDHRAPRTRRQARVRW